MDQTYSERQSTAYSSREFLLFWLPVLTVLAAIASESTRTAGASTTLRLLLAFIRRMHLTAWFTDEVLTNQELRKLGHMTGYGLLGLLVARGTLHAQLARGHAWATALTRATSLGILCAGLAGSLDEWHQSFLPGRFSSVEDVAIDTLGAVIFVLLFRFVIEWNRHAGVLTNHSLPKAMRTALPVHRGHAAQHQRA